MKGLLLKDYYVIRSSLHIQLIMLIFIGVGMAMFISPEVSIVISIITLGLFVSTSIYTDKECKWDMFSRTVPVSINTAISSKYILNILLMILGTVLGIALTVIVAFFTKNTNFSSIATFVLVGISLNLSSSSVNIPASIILDGTKQTLAIILSVIFTSIIFIVTLVVASLFLDVKEYLLSITAILAGISVVVYLVSWIIVPKLLSKRDL